MYAHDSIDLLKDSGIDFARNEAQGIDVQRFGELLISSGIVLNDEVSWQHICMLHLLMALVDYLLLQCGAEALQ